MRIIYHAIKMHAVGGLNALLLQISTIDKLGWNEIQIQKWNPSKTVKFLNCNFGGGISNPAPIKQDLSLCVHEWAIPSRGGKIINISK